MSATKRTYPTKAKHNAELAVAHAKDNPPNSSTSYPESAGGAMVESHTRAQAASALRRPAAKYRKLVGRGKVAEHGLKNDPRGDSPEWLRTIEPLVSSIWVVFLTTFLIGLALEALGTLPSLAIYSSTLGQDGQVPTLALAVGGALMLLGHFAGWMLELASRAGRAARVGLILGVVALLLSAGAAVVAVGDGRDTNLAASGMVIESSEIEARATRLEREAKRLERRGTLKSRAPKRVRREVRRLNRQAEKLRDRAASLKERAFKDRELGWFSWVQLAALILAVVTGWAFSVCSPLRLKRKAERCYRRADKVWAKAWCRCQVIAGLGEQTIALATIHSGSQAEEYEGRASATPESLFVRVMCPPAERIPGSAQSEDGQPDEQAGATPEPPREDRGARAPVAPPSQNHSNGSDPVRAH